MEWNSASVCTFMGMRIALSNEAQGVKCRCTRGYQKEASFLNARDFVIDFCFSRRKGFGTVFGDTGRMASLLKGTAIVTGAASGRFRLSKSSQISRARSSSCATMAETPP